MKTIIKNMTNSVICFSILAIILGIALVSDPLNSLVAFGYISGAYLIIQGIALVIIDIKAWRLHIPFEGFIKGILSIVLGVLLVKDPTFFVTYMGVIFGIWIIISSVDGIKVAAALRTTNAPWVLMIILNIINIFLGCFVLWSPEISAISLTMYVGIVLMAYSIVNIIYMIMIKKNAQEFEEFIVEKAAFEDSVKDDVEAVVAESETKTEE